MPDVILPCHSQSGGRPAGHQHRPVVFLQVSDPVAQGFVQACRRPGGNLTGFTGTEFSVGGNGSICPQGDSPNLAP